jgi:hypothetical protein
MVVIVQHNTLELHEGMTRERAVCASSGHERVVSLGGDSNFDLDTRLQLNRSLHSEV